MPNDKKQLTVEDARIIFRNFSGRETTFNKAGSRNFGLVLDERLAKQLEADGWNVKWPKPRVDQEPDEEDTRSPHLPVAVRYDKMPPRVFMVTNGKKTLLTEETVGLLDGVDIQTVDLTVNGSEWVVDQKSGLKAYLKSMYITIEADELDLKYAGLDD